MNHAYLAGVDQKKIPIADITVPGMTRPSELNANGGIWKSEFEQWKTR
jgi:hypothetical protein